jgi:hypothetical protein
MSQTEAFLQKVRAVLDHAEPGREMWAMEAVLRLSAKWRSTLIGNTITQRDGLTVQGGPFAGMRYFGEVAEGSLAPRLLGSYESELHPHLTALTEGGLDAVVDIGCAEGFYAVGLARLLPDATVYAHDIDANARRLCSDLAVLNGVADRVEVRGEFRGEDFAAYARTHALIICDIEGAEAELLDPVRWPALRSLPVLVETHPSKVAGDHRNAYRALRPFPRRRCGPHLGKAAALPAWFETLSELDRLLAAYEWRTEPTPWLVMRPKT